MSMTISRNSTGVNRLKDILNEQLMPREFLCTSIKRLMTNRFRHSQSSFFVKTLFRTTVALWLP